MDLEKKVKMAAQYSDLSLSELSRRIGTSSQNLFQRLKVGKFSASELEQIAEGMGAKYVYYFEFPDGTKI